MLLFFAGILFEQYFGIGLSEIQLDILWESFCREQENLTSLRMHLDKLFGSFNVAQKNLSNLGVVLKA